MTLMIETRFLVSPKSDLGDLRPDYHIYPKYLKIYAWANGAVCILFPYMYLSKSLGYGKQSKKNWKCNILN